MVGDSGRMVQAILIDGENIASRHAAAILAAAPGAAIRRVYGDVARLNGWLSVPGLRAVHSPPGRNAADIALAVDAIHLAATGAVRDFTLATGDGGLGSVLLYLREAGCTARLACGPQAGADLRAAASAVVTLESPSEAPPAPKLIAPPPAPKPAPPALNAAEQVEACVTAILRKAPGHSLPMSEINGAVWRQTGIKVSDLPQRSWKSWAAARPALVMAEPQGTGPRLRLRA